MGAVLASMKASEQIDALDSLSIDSFKSHYLWTSQPLECLLAPLQEQIDRFRIDYGFRPAISTLASEQYFTKVQR
jgi:hypothetical protein